MKINKYNVVCLAKKGKLIGDMLPDGSVDDKSISNNGDIVKVLATVVSILRNFIDENPQAYIAFTGSTNERTKLYGRILSTYYYTLSKEFKIMAFVNTGEAYEEVLFEPKSQLR